MVVVIGKLRWRLEILGSHWLGETEVSGTLVHVGLELDDVGKSFNEYWSEYILWYGTSSTIYKYRLVETMAIDGVYTGLVETLKTKKKWENVRMGECQKLKSRDLSAREGKIRDKKEIILYNYTYFSK